MIYHQTDHSYQQIVDIGFYRKPNFFPPLFLFNRNPYLCIIIFVICPIRILIRSVIHFHAISCCKFIIPQCWQPFRKYFRIYILHRIRQSAPAWKDCPRKCRDRPDCQPVHKIYRRIIKICDQILKLFVSHLWINVDAEHPADILAVSRRIMLLPKQWYFPFCILIAKLLCCLVDTSFFIHTAEIPNILCVHTAHPHSVSFFPAQITLTAYLLLKYG